MLLRTKSESSHLDPEAMESHCRVPQGVVTGAQHSLRLRVLTVDTLLQHTSTPCSYHQVCSAPSGHSPLQSLHSFVPSC